MELKIKSFNGIGDLLFVTPTLRQVKKTYPECKIIINTNYPELLHDNPYVDKINEDRDGIFLGYPDPIHCKDPTMHHIHSDSLIVEKALGKLIPLPRLKPEVYIDKPEKRDVVGVQVLHKGHWHSKKVWPRFSDLSAMPGFEPIPRVENAWELAKIVAQYRAVVCAEGGISHLAQAVGTAAVVIFGGFASPVWSGYKNQFNITRKLPCSYCYNPRPCVHKVDRACLKDIPTKEVITLIDKIKGSDYGQPKR